MKTFAALQPRTPEPRRAPLPMPPSPSSARRVNVHQILHGSRLQPKLTIGARSSTAPLIQRKLLIKKGKADADASSGANKYLKSIGFADGEFTLRPASNDRVQVDFTFSEWPRVVQQEIPWRMVKSREDHERTPRELQKDIAFRAHVANYSKRLARGGVDSDESESKLSFGTLKGGENACKLAPEYWQIRFGREATRIQVKKGVRPSVAIADLWRRPSEYSLECYGTVLFIQLRALLRSLGPARFDQRFGILVATGPTDFIHGVRFTDLGITSDNYVALLFAQGQVEKRVGRENNFRELIPGDSIYFGKRGGSGYVAIDNGVYVGKGIFYVHPFGLFTKNHMLAKKKKVLTPRRYRWERWKIP